MKIVSQFYEVFFHKSMLIILRKKILKVTDIWGYHGIYVIEYSSVWFSKYIMQMDVFWNGWDQLLQM